MTLAEIRDWMKSLISCPAWYIGKIEGAKEQCIGLYNAAGPPAPIAIGGLQNTSYTTKTISILVHWGRNADIAEQKAREVFAALYGQQAVIGSKRVIMFQMRTNEPVSVGTDNNNIYEHVIEATIFYER